MILYILPLDDYIKTMFIIQLFERGHFFNNFNSPQTKKKLAKAVIKRWNDISQATFVDVYRRVFKWLCSPGMFIEFKLYKLNIINPKCVFVGHISSVFST